MLVLDDSARKLFRRLVAERFRCICSIKAPALRLHVAQIQQDFPLHLVLELFERHHRRDMRQKRRILPNGADDDAARFLERAVRTAERTLRRLLHRAFCLCLPLRVIARPDGALLFLEQARIARGFRRLFADDTLVDQERRPELLDEFAALGRPAQSDDDWQHRAERPHLALCRIDRRMREHVTEAIVGNRKRLFRQRTERIGPMLPDELIWILAVRHDDDAYLGARITHNRQRADCRILPSLIAVIAEKEPLAVAQELLAMLGRERRAKRRDDILDARIKD